MEIKCVFYKVEGQAAPGFIRGCFSFVFENTDKYAIIENNALKNSGEYTGDEDDQRRTC
jgi:hypothetical protein